MSTKDEVYFRICNAVLRLEVEKGHLLWKVSDVAKYSDVTRSLIYYYFGKEKEVIVEEAFRYFLDTFFNLSQTDKMGVRKRMHETLKKMTEMPYIFVLFYLERDKDSEVGRIIREGEERLFSFLQKDFPEMSKSDILKLYILELGAIAYKGLTSDDVDEVFGPYEKSVT